MAVVMGEAAKLMGVLQNQSIPDRWSEWESVCVCVCISTLGIVYIYAIYVYACPYTHTYSSEAHKNQIKQVRNSEFNITTFKKYNPSVLFFSQDLKKCFLSKH